MTRVDTAHSRWGIESTVTLHGAHVIKRYTALYHRLNLQYSRPPEVSWYQFPWHRLPVRVNMPRLIASAPDSLTLAYAGEPLEEHGQYPGLYSWLEYTVRALQTAGIHHRDIHRRNILWHPTEQQFSLIDWTWANTDPLAPAATPRPPDADAPKKLEHLDPTRAPLKETP